MHKDHKISPSLHWFKPVKFRGCDLSHIAKRYGTPSDKYKLARNPHLNPKVFIDKNFGIKNFDHSCLFLSLEITFFVA